MKTLFLLPLIVFVAAGCGKVERVQPATPTPEKVAPVKAARLAPEGTFYLVQGIVRTTGDGVNNVPGGTRVTLVSRDGSTLTVKTEAGQEFQVSRDLLTNDLDTAALILKTDSPSRFELAERIKVEREAARKQNP